MIESLLGKTRFILQPFNTAMQALPFYKSSEWIENHSFTKLNHQYLFILLYPVIKNASGKQAFHFEMLSKPSKRQAYLSNLSYDIQCFQSIRRKEINNNQEFFNHCNSIKSLQTAIQIILNHTPLQLLLPGIFHYDDAIKKLNNHHFQALCLAALVYDFIKNSDDLNQAYFFQSLEQAFLSFEIAKHYRQSPLNSFISSLVHGISLIAIREEIESLTIDHIDSETIIEAAANLLPKLDYWLAKDLGLTDEILFNLKIKYQHAEDVNSDRSLLLAEYGHQCIQLYQYKVLSKKELLFLLHKIDQLPPCLSKLYNSSH